MCKGITKKSNNQEKMLESFTMDSLIKRIMLSAVFIEQKKTFIKVSFSPHHRHLEDITIAFSRMAA